MKEKKIDKEFILTVFKIEDNKICSTGMFLLGSLLSSDDIWSKEDCDAKIEIATEIKEAMSNLTEEDYPVDKKDYIIDICNKAIEIAEQDKSNF